MLWIFLCGLATVILGGVAYFRWKQGTAEYAAANVRRHAIRREKNALNNTLVAIGRASKEGRFWTEHAVPRLTADFVVKQLKKKGFETTPRDSWGESLTLHIKWEK